MHTLVVPRWRIALASALLPIGLAGQEVPRFEVFGGYSQLRPDQGVLKGSGHGGIAGGTFWLTKKFGISADWSRHEFESLRLASPTDPNSSRLTTFDQSRQHVLVGPQFRLLEKGRFSVNFGAGGGATRIRGTGIIETQPVTTPEVFNSTRWKAAARIGGSLDLNLGRSVSWRVVQPDIIYWRDGGNQTDLRVSTGLVFRFGKR